MAVYVNLMRKFANGDNKDTRERAVQLSRAMKEIDDQVAELLSGDPDPHHIDRFAHS